MKCRIIPKDNIGQDIKCSNYIGFRTGTHISVKNSMVQHNEPKCMFLPSENSDRWGVIL